MRTRVKICGITRPEDALAAARCGADAIGLVFYPDSPRAVDADTARAIVGALPPFVSVVGLFVNAAAKQIRAMLDAVPIDLLQFHGAESPADCAAFGKPYIKGVAMRNGIDLTKSARHYAGARGLLLDTYSKDAPGGTGRTFDWERVPGDVGKPVILAGGLSPDNVVQAVRTVRPYAVDVSSGVESAKGIKDERKIEAFIRGIFSVEAD